MHLLFATPWTVAYQAPLSMGFSRQEYRNGLSVPSPRIFLTQRLNPGLLYRTQTLLPSEPPRKPLKCLLCTNMTVITLLPYMPFQFCDVPKCCIVNTFWRFFWSVLSSGIKFVICVANFTHLLAIVYLLYMLFLWGA